MNSTIKRVTKKALALLLAVAMMFSVLSVALTAFADDTVYTVAANKPVIPAKQGTQIDLSKIAVVFDGGEALGENIAWSTTDKTGGVYVDDANKTIDVVGSDIYVVEATYAGDTKTIYIMEPNADGSKVIYNYTFSAEKDLAPVQNTLTASDGTIVIPYVNPNNNTADTDGDGKNDTRQASLVAYNSQLTANPNSDWGFFNTAHQSLFGQTFTTNSGDYIGEEFTLTHEEWITRLNNWAYTANKGLGITTNAAGYMYLKPTSDAGKMISAFTDYTINLTYTPRNDYASTRLFYLLGKYSLVNATYVNGSIDGFNLAKERYAGARIPAAISGEFSTFYSAFTASGGEAYTLDTPFAMANAEYNVKLAFNGNNIALSMKKAADAEYTTIFDAESTENISELKGTIAINNAEPTRQYNKSISVTIDLSEEAAVMDSYLSDLLVIKASKPAIPMYAGKKLNLSSIYFEFDNGAVARGSNIAWSTEVTSGAIEVDNTAKTVTMLAGGIYAITATYAKADAPKTFYIIEPDSNNQAVLMDYKFSANDAGATVLGGESATFGEDNCWTVYNVSEQVGTDTKGLTMTYAAASGGLSPYGNANAFVILNPESKYGKLISSFADYTIEYDAKAASATWANSGHSFSIIGRYNMAAGATATSFEADKYLAYGQPFNSTSNGIVRSNGNSYFVPDGTNFADYNTAGWAMQLRLKLDGDNLIYSVRNPGDAEYKVLYEMAKDSTSDSIKVADAMATKTQAGTVGYYSYNQTRQYSNYYKVYIDFSEEEIKAIDALTSDLLVISANKPAIPMSAKKKLDLTKIYFEFDNGSVASGKDIAWSTADTSGAVEVDDTAKTVSLLSSGMYEITAKLGDEEKIFYVLEPDSNNQVLLYSHTFGADDVIHPSITDDASSPFYGYAIPAYNADSTNYVNASTLYTSNPDSDWALFNYSGQSYIGNSVTLTTDPVGNELDEAYTYTYTADDVTAANYWVVDDKGIKIGTNRHGRIYLKPDSEGGKLISSFSDYTINYTYVTNSYNNAVSFYLLGRYSANNTTYKNGVSSASSESAFYLANETYLGTRLPHGQSAAWTTLNLLSSNNTYVTNTLSAPYTMVANTEYNAKIKLEGNDVTVSLKKASDASYTELYSATSATDTSALKGTIAIEEAEQTRHYSKAISVVVEFSEEEIKAIDALTSDILVVSNAKPALPLAVGKKVNVSDIYFEFDNGQVALGKNITWSTTDNTGGVVVADADKSIALLGSGIYPVTAEYGDEEKIFYVVEPDSNNQVLLYSHTFGAEDLAPMEPLVIDGVNYTPYTNPNKQTIDGASVWASSLYSYAETHLVANENSDWGLFNDNQKKLFGQTFTVNQGSNLVGSTFTYTNPEWITRMNTWTYTANKGIAIGTNASGWLYLKPESEAGQLISQFADYTINYSYVTVAKSNNISTFRVLGKFSANDVSYPNGFTLANETYAGTTLPHGQQAATPTVNVLYNNTSAAQTLAESITMVANTEYNAKIQFKGNNVTVSFKKASDAAFTQLYSANVDASVAESKGVVAVESPEPTRQPSKSISVVVDFSEEEIAMFSNPAISTDLTIVKATNPAIPMTSSTSLRVADIYFEFDNGTVVSGSKVEWESNYNSVAVNNEEDTITLFTAGTYDITAKFGDLKKTFYIIEPDSNNQALLYSHTFGADDVIHPSITDDTSSPFYGYAIPASAANSTRIDSASTVYTSNPDSDWALFNYSGQSYIGNSVTLTTDPAGNELDEAYTYTYTADDVTAANYWVVDAKGIRIGTNKHGRIYLKPDSKGGKLISSFSDYTINYTYVTNSYNNAVSFYLLGRYSCNNVSYVNGSSNGFNLQNETYLGTRLPHGQSAAWTSLSLLSSNNGGAAQTLTNSVTMAANTEYNAKIELEGNDVTVSLKKASDASYTELYSATSATDTSGIKGTIAIEEAEQTRHYSKAISVVVEFDADLISAVKKLSTNISVIPKDNPILPMENNTRLNLNNLYFEFDNGKAVQGSQITWELNDLTGGAVVNNIDKTITVFKEGWYPVVATYGENTKTFYAFVPGASGEHTIYSHTFSDKDVTDTDNAVTSYFTEESEWLFDASHDVDNNRASNVRWDTTSKSVVAMYSDDLYDHESNQYWLGDRGTGTIFLNPYSESGKYVSQFRDVIVEAEVVSTTNATSTGRGFIGPIARMQINRDFLANFYFFDAEDPTVMYPVDANINWTEPDYDTFDTLWSGKYMAYDDDTGEFTETSIPVDRVASLWRIQGAETTPVANATAFTLDISGENLSSIRTSDNRTVPYVEQNFKFYDIGDGVGNPAVSIQRLEVIGNTVKGFLREKTTETTFNEAQFTLTDAQISALPNTKAGTIGFHFNAHCRGGLRSIKVIVKASDEAKALIKSESTDLDGVYMIPADKPAIPMYAGYKLDMSEIYFAFDNGVIASGSMIDFSTEANAGFALDNDSKTITMINSGSYTMTATFANADEPKTIYVAEPDENNEAFIASYDFTSADNTIPSTNGVAQYANRAFGSDDTWIVYNLSSAVAYTAYAEGKGLSIAHNGHAYVLLNPESEFGKAVTTLSDYTLELSATNFKADWKESGYLKILGRYNMTGTYPVEANDDFLGFLARYNTETKGSVLASKGVSYTATNALASYDSSAMAIDVRMQFLGDTTTVWSKNKADSDYTLLYKSTDDTTTDTAKLDAVKATAGIKNGTVGWYSYGSTRPYIDYFNVYIPFDETMINNVKEDCVKVNILSQNKPAIPMSIGQTMDLKLITLATDDGVLIPGDKATWTLSDINANVTYNEEHKVITASSSGYCTLTATDAKGNSAVVYITVANNKGQYVIYNHTFSFNDLELEDDGDYVFTQKSEWYGKNTSGTDDSAIGLGYNFIVGGSGQSRYLGASNGNDVGYALYLRPDSPSGIKVSKFADIMLDTHYLPYANNPNFYGTYLRLQINEDGSIGNNFAQTMSNGIADSTDLSRFRVNKNNYNNNGNYIREYRDLKLPDGTAFRVLRFNIYYATYGVEGNELGTMVYATKADYSDAVTIKHDPTGKAVLSNAAGETVELSAAVNRAYDSEISKGGTIGFFAGPQAIVTYDFVTVRLTFSDEELAFFAQFIDDPAELRVVEYEDISEYRGETNIAPDAPYNKVFAGWYHDEKCTEPLEPTVTSGKAYAKFVSIDVFGVKWQITDPADEARGGKVDMRIVSSVDSHLYEMIGFEIKRSDGLVANKAYDTVYRQITGEQGTALYDPTVFSGISKYFATTKLTNMDWAKWGDQPFTVTTVIVTKDGTVVYNTDGAFTFKPSYDNKAIDLAESELLGEINSIKDSITADKVYYVSNDGTDGFYAGTKTAPFKTLTYAMSKAKTYKDATPNATVAILLERGDTFREGGALRLMKDLSIGAYGTGAKPKIYGSWDVAKNTASSDIPVQKIDSFQIDLDDTKQAGLNGDVFTAPEGTDLWSIDLTSAWGPSHVDIGSIFFVEDAAEENVIAADKKWFRASDNVRYNASLDDLAEAYDFFYDYNNSKAYVLIPEGKNFSDYAHVEVQNANAVLYIQPSTLNEFEADDSMDNIKLQNLELRYGNFGISASHVNMDVANGTFSALSNFVCEGLEIGWIGGARQKDEGVYTSSDASSYTRLGNGIEVWSGCDGFTVDKCYFYQVYDAAVTFQFNLKYENYADWANFPTEFNLYNDITITNNVLTDNVYNFEYFLTVDLEESASVKETFDKAKINNVLFADNICRRAGGTADNEMWGLAYRPDKGVSAHIKGSTTYGNHTTLDANGDSTFVIENNIFDSAVDRALSVSASNEGGEPEFRNNLYIVANGEQFNVNAVYYTGDAFKNNFDAEGALVMKAPATATSVYASPRTLNSAGAVEVNDLSNTKYKLTTQGETLRVGYIGGSVTGGQGATDASTLSWRALTTDYLRGIAAENGASVTETNAAVGGTSSYWAYFRMDEDLLKTPQDLVFVEFSVNDNYSGLSEMDSAVYMEGIVKKIRSSNSYADIVFVFVTDSAAKGTETEWIKAHKAVAAHYGIPTIDVGKALIDSMEDIEAEWETYFTDIVHPTDAGYQAYADTVADALDGILEAVDTPSYEKNAMPSVNLVSNQSTSSIIVTADKITNFTGFELVDESTVENSELRYEKALLGSIGSTLQYSFTGKTFGLHIDGLDNTAGEVEVVATIDGSTSVTKSFKSGNNIEWVLIDNLAAGRHTVKLEITSGGNVTIGALLIAN